MVTSQKFFLLKMDGSCAKSKFFRGTVIQRNVKRRYKKLSYIFNSYTNKKFYKKYKKTL